MGGAGVHVPGAAHFHNGLGGVAQGTGGIHHVVEEDAVLTLHVTDDVHDFALVGLLTALIHDGQVHMELLSKGASPGHRAHIGGHDDHIVAFFAELLGIIVHKYRIAQKVIHRDVEKALDLSGVKVHGEDPVSAGGGKHIGYQLGGDGVTGLGLAVLTGIAKIGDDSGDAAGGRPLHGIDHDQQLHQVVVDGTAGGLDQKYIGTADGLINGGEHLAVCKMADLRIAQLDADQLTDVLCKTGIGIAAEHLHIFAV